MTKSNFYLYVTIYNYRNTIVDSEVDLENYDSDELEEYLNELDESDEIEWNDDFSSQRKEPTEIENSAGDKYTIVFNDSKLKFDCPNCPTTLYVDSSNYVKNKDYKCPKCSTSLGLVANNSDNFVLMQS
jgi:predicted RNA-binding Zn-ribbon protein involved in translation (DUF1610 family)